MLAALERDQEQMDLEITHLTPLQKLLYSWRNEKSAPEILSFEYEACDAVSVQLERQVCISIHKNIERTTRLTTTLLYNL